MAHTSTLAGRASLQPRKAEALPPAYGKQNRRRRACGRGRRAGSQRSRELGAACRLMALASTSIPGASRPSPLSSGARELLPQAQRAHVRPDFLDIGQALLAGARLPGILPAERVLPARRPDGVLFLVIHHDFEDHLVVASLHGASF